MNIQTAINDFIGGRNKNKGRQPDERYASFDYCYNYFYSFYKNNNLKKLANPQNLQTSCLQLGFYLASWGMMRGSSFLLEKSVRNYKGLIQTISEINPKLWEIDVNNYNDENIALLMDCKKQIIHALGKQNKPSDTLITKIMLGVFANVPAYDQYFRKTFKVHTFNKKSLIKISDFYYNNKSILDSYNIKTIDFFSAKQTKRSYTKAKLIDMYGFMNSQ